MAFQTNALKNILTAALALALLSYPFLVYWGLKNMDVRWLALGLFIISGLRWAWSRKKDGLTLGPVAIAATLCLFIVAALSKDPLIVKLYPTLVNLLFLSLFASSLRRGQMPTVEKLARIRDKDLSPRAILYTRRVTKIWCVFFVINGALCTYFAVQASTETWTFYTGFLSYIFMGTLFAIEYLCRRRLQRIERAAP